MQIVLDTNVLVSGIFWSGTPHNIVKAWANHEFQIMANQSMLKEYFRIIARISKNDKLTEQWKVFITENINLLKDVHLTKICRDPKDNMFLNCALAGNADYIVSGDDDLLALKSIKDIEIIKPASFLKLLKKK